MFVPCMSLLMCFAAPAPTTKPQTRPRSDSTQLPITTPSPTTEGRTERATIKPLSAIATKNSRLIVVRDIFFILARCPVFLRCSHSIIVLFLVQDRKKIILEHQTKTGKEWWRYVSPSQGLHQCQITVCQITVYQSETDEAPERAKRISTISFPPLSTSDVLKWLFFWKAKVLLCNFDYRGALGGKRYDKDLDKIAHCVDGYHKRWTKSAFTRIQICRYTDIRMSDIMHAMCFLGASF